MSAPPLLFSWDGEAMTPVGRHGKTADEHFVIGRKYILVEQQERSAASHNHEFAWLNEAWKNLPESLAELYPSPLHLRKRALIEAGFYDEEIVDAGTSAAAIRVASAFRHREEFSLVIVRGPIVVIRSAKSQSRRAMDKKDFQASKTAVMEVVSALIGVKPTDLAENAAEAA